MRRRSAAQSPERRGQQQSKLPPPPRRGYVFCRVRRPRLSARDSVPTPRRPGIGQLHDKGFGRLVGRVGDQVESHVLRGCIRRRCQVSVTAPVIVAAVRRGPANGVTITETVPTPNILAVHDELRFLSSSADPSEPRL